MNDEDFKRSIEERLEEAARLGRDSGGMADAVARHAELEAREEAAAESRRRRSAYGQAVAAQEQRAVADSGQQESRPMVRARSGLGKAAPLDGGSTWLSTAATPGAAQAVAPVASTPPPAQASVEVNALRESRAVSRAAEAVSGRGGRAPLWVGAGVVAALAAYVAWPDAQTETGDVASSQSASNARLAGTTSAAPTPTPTVPSAASVRTAPASPAPTSTAMSTSTPTLTDASPRSTPTDVATLDPAVTLRTAPPSAGRLTAPVDKMVADEPLPVAGWPTLGVISESGDGTPSLLAADFARQVGPSAQMNVAPITTNGWAASLAALRVQPRVTVARYDLLQAVKRVPEAASVPPLEIVAPLATEPVYFVVRADAPLRYIHEIEAKIINIGPQNSARALTAATVYRDMFATAVPASRLSRLDEAAALDELVHGQGIDVVVVVGSSPQGLLGRLGRDRASPVKLLELDPSEPASGRVVRTFLPATIDAGALGSFPASAVTTLSVMSFLVTSPGAKGDGGGHDQAIASLARSLCTQLPELRRDSNSAWRGVQPGLQLDVGYPYSSAAQRVFADCPVAIAPARRVAGS